MALIFSTFEVSQLPVSGTASFARPKHKGHIGHPGEKAALTRRDEGQFFTMGECPAEAPPAHVPQIFYPQKLDSAQSAHLFEIGIIPCLQYPRERHRIDTGFFIDMDSIVVVEGGHSVDPASVAPIDLEVKPVGRCQGQDEFFVGEILWHLPHRDHGGASRLDKYGI